jgi:hypothetical protein
MEELGKKMKIEMDSNSNSNYGHLERPNLFKALQEAYALQERVLITILFHIFSLQIWFPFIDSK